MIGTGPYHVIVTAVIDHDRDWSIPCYSDHYDLGTGPYHVIVTALIDHDRDWSIPCYSDRCDRS